MRTFGIVDMSVRSDKRKPCATLFYDEAADEYEIEVMPWASEDDVPMLLIPFVHRKQRTLGKKWSRAWVEERVVPPSRQNLGQVLKANGLDEYDSFHLLLASMGRCSQDDFALVELDDGQAGSDSPAIPPVEPQPRLARDVGRKLALARKQAGLTQAELAQRAGVQQSVVSRVERGEGNPTLALVEQLACALGCQARLVLTDNDKRREGAHVPDPS